MVGSSSEQGFGQRGEQNWSWVNQSIIAVTHRLTRPVNYNQDNPAKPPAVHESGSISDFKTANSVVLAISLAIGLGYIAVMPARSRTDAALECRRTRYPVLSDDGGVAAGPAVLFHVAVLSDDHPDTPRRLSIPALSVRAGTWTALAIAGLLMCLSFPVFPNDLQAFGNNLAATAVISGRIGLAHPASASRMDTAGSLVPATRTTNRYPE